MPRVRRSDLPRPVIAHLARRVRERHVPVQDLQALARWLDTDPAVPAGRWYKRFARIIVCGEGALVTTILEDRHTAIGREVE